MVHFLYGHVCNNEYDVDYCLTIGKCLLLSESLKFLIHVGLTLPNHSNELSFCLLDSTNFLICCYANFLDQKLFHSVFFCCSSLKNLHSNDLQVNETIS